MSISPIQQPTFPSNLDFNQKSSPINEEKIADSLDCSLSDNQSLAAQEQKNTTEIAKIENLDAQRTTANHLQPRSIHEHVLNGFVRKQNEMEIQRASEPRTFYRFYKPNWSLADLCGLSNMLKIHGRYENAIGAIYPSNAPNGLGYAIAGMAVRRDYAERAYELLVKKWDIQERKPLSDFTPLLDPFTRKATNEEIDALVEYRKKLLNAVVEQLCDENGVPLDPCIEKIFVPTPEERRDLFKIPPEGIVQSDAIYFMFKRESITIPEERWPDPKLLDFSNRRNLRIEEFQNQVNAVLKEVEEHPPILNIGPSPTTTIFKRVIYPREILAPPLASSETIGWTMKKGITQFGSMVSSFFLGDGSS